MFLFQLWVTFMFLTNLPGREFWFTARYSPFFSFHAFMNFFDLIFVCPNLNVSILESWIFTTYVHAAMDFSTWEPLQLVLWQTLSLVDTFNVFSLTWNFSLRVWWLFSSVGSPDFFCPWRCWSMIQIYVESIVLPSEKSSRRAISQLAIHASKFWLMSW